MRLVAKYQFADNRRAIWQMVNTIVPHYAFWALAYLTLDTLWLSLVFSFIAGLFGVRTFVIFHDCGHGSFFTSQRANNIVGFITGVITFTPYQAWRHAHAVHHARSGDLDRRGIGDVWTLTYEEYQALSPGKRLSYRLFRNPLVMFVVGPPFAFFILQRIQTMNGAEKPQDRLSVTFTNMAIIGLMLLAAFTIGFKEYLMVQLPILAFSTPIGVWLFYVQHQYENTYWERHKDWNYMEAALYGSSYYKLPAVLNWFTGNIGYHHIHHLSPRIPNYKLPQAHRENPLFQVKPMTIRESLKSFKVRLWDEDRHKMIGYYRAPEEAAL